MQRKATRVLCSLQSTTPYLELVEEYTQRNRQEPPLMQGTEVLGAVGEKEPPRVHVYLEGVLFCPLPSVDSQPTCSRNKCCTHIPR